MATYARTRLEDFDLNNPVYAGATVTAWQVDANGNKLGTKATLFEALTGTEVLENPQTLNSKGRWVKTPYIEEQVILTVSGVTAFADHDTGIISPNLSATDADAAVAAKDSALFWAKLAEGFMQEARRIAKQPVSGFLEKVQNLADLPNKATARANLGVAIGTDVQGFDQRILNTVHLFNAEHFV